MGRLIFLLRMNSSKKGNWAHLRQARKARREKESAVAPWEGRAAGRPTSLEPRRGLSRLPLEHEAPDDRWATETKARFDGAFASDAKPTRRRQPDNGDFIFGDQFGASAEERRRGQWELTSHSSFSAARARPSEAERTRKVPRPRDNIFTPTTAPTGTTTTATSFAGGADVDVRKHQRPSIVRPRHQLGQERHRLDARTTSDLAFTAPHGSARARPAAKPRENAILPLTHKGTDYSTTSKTSFQATRGDPVDRIVRGRGAEIGKSHGNAIGGYAPADVKLDALTTNRAELAALKPVRRQTPRFSRSNFD